jgi:gag-polypeptide of LTR copia-type
MTSSLGTGPFLFFQGDNNDPAAILRILDLKHQGTDTSSVLSADNEFTAKKYRPGQNMEMFVAEFEGMAMRLEAIGHDVSEQMRVVNFLNLLSEVSALSAVLSALRVIGKLNWAKCSAPWLPKMDSPAPVTHAAGLVIAARTTLIVDVTRAFIPCVVMERTVVDITLIVTKEIVAWTIVKVTEVRAKEERVAKKTCMDVTVKEVTSLVSATEMMETTTGATPGHLLSDITTVIHLTMQTLHRTTTSSIAPLQPFWPRTMLVTDSTRRQLWSIPVPLGTYSTCYALPRMRPLSISCAEGFVVISRGKVDYDKSGSHVD